MAPAIDGLSRSIGFHMTAAKPNRLEDHQVLLLWFFKANDVSARL
jgi:hypothetical protein